MNSPTCFSDKSPSAGRHSTLLHELHQHMGQGLDSFEKKPSMTGVYMHVTISSVNGGTSKNVI
jgi:hypothetical protein